MIEVKSVVKQYGRKRVLDNVSLKIEKGRITSFIDQMVPVKVPCYRS